MAKRDAAGKEAEQAVKEAARAELPQTGSRNSEPIYTVAEFAVSANRIFGTDSDIVKAALDTAGINACTVEEARKRVDSFMKKEVR